MENLFSKKLLAQKYVKAYRGVSELAPWVLKKKIGELWIVMSATKQEEPTDLL